MEPIRACLNEEWESSLSGVFSNFEADQFMAHLYDANNEYSNTFRNNGMISSNFLSIDETSMNINDIGGVNLYNFANSLPNSQKIYEENSYSSGSNSPFFPTQGYENNHFFSETNQMTVSCNNTYEHRNIFSEGFLVPNFPRVMEENFITKTELVNHENPENDFHQSSTTVYSGEELKLKRKYHVQEHETSGDGKMNELVESPKKKPRLPRDAHKVKRNALSKKNKKNSLDGTDDEEKSGTKDVQDHPNSCNSEDDNLNIASQDFKGKANTALNSSGKTRACRGAATDPQSLYARKRRERINERLRILQNLVPNGTKVDISTMLEEAVQYVKFLQLQIKLLSSDEMWMFAPIAYNGMDMGLYDKLSM